MYMYMYMYMYSVIHVIIKALLFYLTGSLPLCDWCTDYSPAGDQPVPSQHGAAKCPNHPPSEPGGCSGQRERGSPRAGHPALSLHPGARTEGAGTGGSEGPARGGQVHCTDSTAGAAITA